MDRTILRIASLIVFLSLHPFIAYLSSIVIQDPYDYSCKYKLSFVENVKCMIKNFPYINKCKLCEYNVDYQIRDKIVDTITNLVALIAVRKVIDEEKYNLLKFLFLFRLIGVLAFTYKRDDKYLFLFPNYFEFFFLFLLFGNYLDIKIDGRISIFISYGMIFGKLLQEYLMKIL